MTEPRRITLQVGQRQLGGMALDPMIFIRTWTPVDPIGTIVCFHGYTDNSSDFTFFGEAAGRSGYRVVCPDWPGRGRSRWLTPDRYDLTLFRSMMAIMIEQAAKPVTLIASSWSTFIALPYLATSSRQPASAILVDAILSSGPAFDHVVEVLASEASIRFRDQEALRIYLAQTRPSVSTLSLEDQRRYARRHTAFIHGEIRIDYDPSLSTRMGELRGRRVDLTEIASKVRVPTMMIYGRNSIFRNHDAFGKILSKNPFLTLREDFPGGHPPLLDDQWQVEAVLSFVRAVQSTSS